MEASHPGEMGYLPQRVDFGAPGWETRFQMMVEFMKEKYNQETPEMKVRCEEYRRCCRDESPVASANEDAERNSEFQA